MDYAAKRRRCGLALIAGLVAAALPAVGLLIATPAVAAPVVAAGTALGDTHRFASVCEAPLPGQAACLSVVDLDAVHPLATSSTTPSGFGPADLQSAYKLPSSTAGSGHTVAIVDAYDLPTAQSDLNAYRAQYGLPVCGSGCFTKVNQDGGSTLPAANDGWAQEIALDLDMVSAACPNCNILLVEAFSANLADLGTAVNTAVRMGAMAVSNSYGAVESVEDLSLDASYFNHPGVAITAASGDNGYGASYPAASQYVTAVGGTSLHRSSTPRGFSEGAWSGAGSGCSGYDPKPSWQHDTGCVTRTVSDVSAVADPSTGVAMYYTRPSTHQQGWNVVGGTSASSPLVAGVYALGSAIPATSTPATFPYANPTALFDVTSGSNGSCGTYICNSGVGYDGPTGLGTPNGISAFSATTTAAPTTTVAPTTTSGHDPGAGGPAPGTTAPVSTAPATTTPAPVSSPPYVGRAPMRVQDTRNGAGGISSPDGTYAGGPLAAGRSYSFSYAAAGIPTGQSAYVFNVTAINPTGTGNLRVAPGSARTTTTVPNWVPSWVPGWAKGWVSDATSNSSPPSTSLINYQPGQGVANLVIVPNTAGAGVDTLQVYSAGSAADVAFDLVGYYPPVATGSAAAITAVTPSRIVDTRTGAGTKAGAPTIVGAGASQSFQVGGVGGLPATGAKAVALNVTAINPTGVGNLRIYADGAPAPLASNINYIPGQDKSVFVIVTLPANGKIAVYSAGTPVDVAIDAYASYDAVASNLVTQTPIRIVDSRASDTAPATTLTAGNPVPIQVTGNGGVPAGAKAVLISVTSIHTSGSTGSGNLQVYPTGPIPPGVSTVNYVSPTADIANFAIVTLSSTGQLTLATAGSPTDVTVDVLGYVPAG